MRQKKLWTGILNRDLSISIYLPWNMREWLIICQMFCQWRDLIDMSKEVHSPRGSDPLTKLIKHRGIHQVDSCHFSINQKMLNVFSEPLLVEWAYFSLNAFWSVCKFPYHHY